MVSGVIAFGIDFDQLRFRSTASTIATHIHDFLMAPHSAVVRSLPNAWLTRPGVIPLLLIAHHLLWGAVGALVFVLARRRRAQ